MYYIVMLLEFSDWLMNLIITANDGLLRTIIKWKKLRTFTIGNPYYYTSALSDS